MIFLSAASMKKEFLIGYDKVTNLAAPGYTDDEISTFLSRAQDAEVIDSYNIDSKRSPGAGLEQTERKRKDISELVRDAVDSGGNLTTAISANQFGTFPNGTFFDLPTDFLYAISERVETDINCSESPKVIDVKAITHDQYNANKDNPWKKPTDDLAWRLDFSRVSIDPNEFKRHELISDGTYQITKYFLRYLKRPRDIDIAQGIDCELDASLHRRIVDRAVEIALENTGDPRYQLTRAKNLETE